MRLAKVLLALLAGAMNVFAFAPFGWWPLCLLSFGILFGLWLNCNRTAAAGYGFVFGLGMFGVGTSWIYVSLHNFGGMSPWLAGLCVVLLVMVASLWLALAGWSQGCFLRRTNSQFTMVIRAVIIMPVIWMVFEWLRGWLLSGFPWLTSGYAMLDTPIAGLAPLGGVYLVSLLTLMSAGVLLALLIALSWEKILLSLFISLAWVGGWHALHLPWTQAQGTEISVALIQNNVPLALKWEPTQRDSIIADYLAQSALHREADLIVWPEAAVPDYLDRLSDDFYRQIREHPADFIFGILTRETVNQSSKYFNSIVAVSKQTTLYHKKHLVPFGEFMPFKPLFQSLLDRLNIPVSNLTSWQPPQAPLQAAGNYFAASVCYEDAFPQIWRARVADTGLLINVSEDMWFGDSLAPHQRLQMARFRSLETGRAMLRVTNNGLSSVINWRGGIDASAAQFVKAVVTAKVQPRTGSTPYSKYGEYPVLGLAFLLFVLGYLFCVRSSPQNSPL